MTRIPLPPTLGLRAALRDERGFTMIELLVVLVIIGILVAIAVPSHLGFKNRAHDTSAKANVRSVRPALETYFADNDGTVDDSDANAATVGYEGMTIAHLQAIDSSVSAATVAIGTLTPTSFCVSSTNHGHSWHQDGPSAAITSGPCP